MTPGAATETRYGWVVVAALTLLLGCTHGLISSGISVFDSSILTELHLTRGALKLRDLIQLFSAGAWALAIGFAAGKVGPRTIIYTGLVLLTFAMLAYGEVQSVQQIYLLHLVLAFCYSSCHVVVVLLVLTRWFATRRNTALGIILAGESLGGTIFPQVVVKLIALVGWREALQWMACIPVVLIALMAMVLRESPEKMGKMPFGWRSAPLATAAAPAPTTVARAPVSFFDQLLRRDVLIVILTAALIYYVGGGIAAHTFLYFRDKGLDSSGAAVGLSLFFAAAFVGKFSSGFFSERWPLLNVWIAFQLVMLLGAIAITFDAAGWPYFIIPCLGLGWGGCYTLSQALLMQRFDGPYLARLSGITVLAEGLTAGLGSFLTGLMFDRFGNYTVSFAIMSALLLISAISSLGIRNRAQNPGRLPAGEPLADNAY